MYTFTTLPGTHVGYTATCPPGGVLTYNYMPGVATPQNLNFGFICTGCEAQIKSVVKEENCAQLSLTLITTAANTEIGRYQLEVNWGDGITDHMPITYQTAYDVNNFNITTGYGSKFTHTYSTYGTYPVKYVTIRAGKRVDSTSFNYTTTCNEVGGVIFNDENADCTYHPPTEAKILNPIKITVDSAGIMVDTLVTAGTWQYKIKSITPAVYTFRILNGAPSGYLNTCANSWVYNFQPSVFPLARKDFGFTCDSSGFDLSLRFSGLLQQPGALGRYYKLYAENLKCTPENGTVIFQVSPLLNVITSGIRPFPANVTNNTVVWNLANLQSGNTPVSLIVPVAPVSAFDVNLDSLCNTGWISPRVGDVNVLNNTFEDCSKLVSQNPISKQVSPPGSVTPGTLLTYTINIANMDVQVAKNMLVIDKLSEALDASTFQLLRSSHPVVASQQVSNGDNILQFDFQNINLPSFSTADAPVGSVVFTIRLKSNIANLTTVANKATITNYKTTNVTNSVYNIINYSNSIKETAVKTSNLSLSYWPNPATNTIFINIKSSSNQATLRMVNIIGQEISKDAITLKNGTATLSKSVSSLPAGIYFLSVEDESGKTTGKLVIEK